MNSAHVVNNVLQFQVALKETYAYLPVINPLHKFSCRTGPDVLFFPSFLSLRGITNYRDYLSIHLYEHKQLFVVSIYTKI